MHLYMYLSYDAVIFGVRVRVLEICILDLCTEVRCDGALQ